MGPKIWSVVKIPICFLTNLKVKFNIQPMAIGQISQNLRQRAAHQSDRRKGNKPGFAFSKGALWTFFTFSKENMTHSKRLCKIQNSAFKKCLCITTPCVSDEFSHRYVTTPKLEAGMGNL